MKYIIIQVGEKEIPLMFSELIMHSEIVRLFNNVTVSAGYVTHGGRGELKCFGKSIGLELPSRPQDSGIVNDELIPFDWDAYMRELDEFEKRVAAAKGAGK